MQAKTIDDDFDLSKLNLKITKGPYKGQICRFINTGMFEDKPGKFKCKDKVQLVNKEFVYVLSNSLIEHNQS